MNEAHYLGIDTKALEKESFTSPEHIAMVRKHEEMAKAYWDRNRVTYAPAESPKTPRRDNAITTENVKPIKLATRAYKFTPAQLEIALKAQQKNGK
jgi:hypothetical protein